MEWSHFVFIELRALLDRANTPQRGFNYGVKRFLHGSLVLNKPVVRSLQQNQRGQVELSSSVPSESLLKSDDQNISSTVFRVAVYKSSASCHDKVQFGRCLVSWVSARDISITMSFPLMRQ